MKGLPSGRVERSTSPLLRIWYLNVACAKIELKAVIEAKRLNRGISSWVEQSEVCTITFQLKDYGS